MAERPDARADADALAGLPLAEPTARGWARAALADVDALLADHAHCEQKAAAAGLSLLGRYPDCRALVRPMIALVHEEMHHFRQVLDLVERRGGALGRPPEDAYVRLLRHQSFQAPGGLGTLTDRLLVCGLIEARSCERFRLLAEGLGEGHGALEDGERRALAAFYERLAAAEGRHWETFRDLAATVRPRRAVDARLAALAALEAEIVRRLPARSGIH